MRKTTLDKPFGLSVESEYSQIEITKVFDSLVTRLFYCRPVDESLKEVLGSHPFPTKQNAGGFLDTFAMIDVGRGPDVPDELLLVEERLGPLDVVLFPSHVRSPCYSEPS